MIAGSICANFLEPNQVYTLFILPALFGIGTATILVQSLSIVAALIGGNAASAAFVYGALTFAGIISRFVLESQGIPKIFGVDKKGS